MLTTQEKHPPTYARTLVTTAKDNNNELIEKCFWILSYLNLVHLLIMTVVIPKLLVLS